ncbi:4-alpha-glucanotransferase, partial [Yersinia enterocolitica]|nr:4-alpha-glucanotransferase [Yersinia enterocolitica]
MDRKSLDQAATLAGIAANYINAHGKSQAISAQTKQQLLAAMGRTSMPPDSQTEKAPLPPVKIFTFGSAMQLPMAGSGDYHWQLQTEKGDLHQGRISAKKTLTLPASLP